MNCVRGRMTLNQYGDNILSFNFPDAGIRHQIGLFVMSREGDVWQK